MERESLSAWKFFLQREKPKKWFMERFERGEKEIASDGQSGKIVGRVAKGQKKILAGLPEKQNKKQDGK